MGRVLAFVAALALAGCAVPPPAGVSVPTYSPIREALAYFPQDAPLVAVVRTDPQDPGLRRLAGSGALRPLRREAARRGVFFKQLRGLLGNAAAVGVPHPGASPLAVLVTEDEDELGALARSRVVGGRATPAGSYRGADLFAESGWSFGVRGRTLLASTTTRDLLDALDTRTDGDGFEAAQLNDVRPEPDPPAAFLRGYVNLTALVDRAGSDLRAVPVLRALGPAGVTLGATAEELRGVLSTDTAGVGLTSEDLPGLERPAGTRPALPPRARALAVTDLPALARAAERALRAARPVSALALDGLRARLRGAGVVLAPELLAGAAVITETPAVRLDPAQPAALRAAVDRVARRLGLKPARARLLTLRGVRFGFVGGVFVAGRAPVRNLLRLAAAPTVPARSPVLVRLPRVADWFPRPAVFTLAGSPQRLTVQLYSGF